MSDADLVARCREDGLVVSGKDVAKLRQVGLYRIKFAQLRQPPASLLRCRQCDADGGVFLAGEYTGSSNINGAMRSGAGGSGSAPRARMSDPAPAGAQF
jgi:hypothetical protein